jgi:hypothetical protein
MRRAVQSAAAAALLAGPTALAFFSGGYFSGPRLAAAIVAWGFVLLLALAGPAPLPRSLAGWLALGGLAAITVWTAISISWAPVRGPAQQDVERLLLYVGALSVAIGVLRVPAVLRAVEPALAAGATIVVGEGLSGRLLPGLVHLEASVAANGRLEQPITYWNGEGALAAVGFLLCARLAGDRSRPVWMRAGGAACSVPLAAGIYLSYSRGAIAVAILGLLVLVAAAPYRSQLWAALLVFATGLVASLCSSAFPGVASLKGGLGSRESDGAAMLAILVVLAAAAVFLTLRLARAEGRDRVSEARLPLARRLVPISAAAIGLVVLGLLIGGLREKASPADLAGAKATRLTTVQSNRYYYWRVGGRAFIHHPFGGLGAGGFRVAWLKERPFREGVLDVHSLELEMASELGIVGLLAFCVLIGGIALAARRAMRTHPALAAGSLAAGIAWLLHASIDWDWQLPAVSLPAIVLAGVLIALGESAPGSGLLAEGEGVESKDGREGAAEGARVPPATDYEELAPRG